MSKLSERLGASNEDDKETNLVYQLKRIRDKKKELDKQDKEITKKLSDRAENRGQKDGKGNYSFKMGDYMFVKQCINSEHIDEKRTYKLFRKKGWEPPYIIENIKVFDEDMFATKSHLLSKEEKESLIEKTVSYRTQIRHIGNAQDVEE